MIDELGPYPAYKDSGVPWLGEVPEHWEVRRNGRLFSLRKESGFPDLPVLEVSIREGVRVRDMDADGRKQQMGDRSLYQRAIAGDIAYNTMRMWQGAVGVVPTDGLASPAYVVARPHLGVCSRYFVHLFRTPTYLREVDAFSRGIVSDRNRLYWEFFKQMPSVYPPLEEQTAIVRFLEHLDRRIRRYIRAKQKLIALLNEQKQAIIHRAVTRGLDPNVRLKPSSAGQVPEHWEVLALKRVLRQLIDCEHKTAPAVVSSDYRVVRTTAIRHGHLRQEGTYCTTEEGFHTWTRRGTPCPGDVMFTREAPAGEACVVPPGQQLCLGQRTVLMKLRRDRCEPQFLVNMIYGGPPADRIRLASQGSTVGHFNMDDIAAMTILAPPLDEQRALAGHIEEATRSLQVAESRAEHEIDLLREHRTRLVADVVTGKLDVRGAAAHLPQTFEQPERLEGGELLAEGNEVGEEAGIEAAAEEIEA